MMAGAGIGPHTTLEELAALVSQTLEQAGVTATLSGGGAVTFYTCNEYESYDLDFVTRAGMQAIEQALAPLGLHRTPGARELRHDETSYYVEFPPGPLGFGETTVADSEAVTLETGFGPVRILSPTHVVMDRLSAYVAWHDNPSFDQAVMVASRQDIDWPALYEWARVEGTDTSLVDRVRRLAELPQYP